jgi:L-lactate dehydrogenase (cytochrome)
MSLMSSADFADRARRRLPRFLFDYIEGGSYDEITLRENRVRLDAVRLRQRVLVDVAEIDIKTTLFGQEVALPIGLGPVGLAGMCAPRGEVLAARAAQAAKIPFCLSTVSVCDIAEVGTGTEAPFWFQLYMVRDRGFMRDLLAKARLHCSALVFTVDMPAPATRYRDFRSGMSGAPGLAGSLRRLGQAMTRPGWSLDVGLRGRPHTLGNLQPVLGRKSGMQDFAGWIGRNFDPSVTWRDLDWVRQAWDGPMIIKGVLDPDDARAAVGIGADGLVVSNHGGRQLDGALGTASALPAVAKAVDGRLTVLADGGVRSGLDVLRMLALGADGVLLGRAWAYALAADGEGGVNALIAMMRRDLLAGMAMTGVRSVQEARLALS